jgi:hypothetical protein
MHLLVSCDTKAPGSISRKLRRLLARIRWAVWTFSMAFQGAEALSRSIEYHSGLSDAALRRMQLTRTDLVATLYERQKGTLPCPISYPPGI